MQALLEKQQDRTTPPVRRQVYSHPAILPPLKPMVPVKAKQVAKPKTRTHILKREYSKPQRSPLLKPADSSYTYYPARSFNRKAFSPAEIDAIFRKETMHALRALNKSLFYAAMYGDREAGQWLRDTMHCLYGMPL